MNKYPTEEFIKYYESGLTDTQIAKYMNCSTGTIFAKRKVRNLPKNNMPKKVDNNMLKILHEKGHTDGELAIYFNVPNQWISIKRRKLGLIENKKSTKIKDLTYEEEQVLIGLILGDGHLIKNSNSKRGGTSGSMVHGVKQKEYIEWKQGMLSRLSTPVKLRTYYSTREQKIQERYESNINTHHCLNKYYDLFYDDDKFKHLKKEIVDLIGPLALAVWFMDDGCNHRSGFNIYTNGFPLEEQKEIAELLSKKFGLKITTNSHFHKERNKKYYYLYIWKESVEQFQRLIKPYIIDSMKYKIKN